MSYRIPILVEESAGIPRPSDPIRLGVPLPRGRVHDLQELMVVGESGGTVPYQLRALALWPDRSVKWLLADLLVTVEARQRIALFVCPKTAGAERPGPPPAALGVAQTAAGVTIDTGMARYEIDQAHPGCVARVRVGTACPLSERGSRAVLLSCDGREYTPRVERLFIEERGPVRASIVAEGGWHSGGRASPLRFKSRAVFLAGSASLRLEFQLRNPQAARHPGGIWDLGDPGSCFFEDLTLYLHPAGSARELRWYAEQHARTQRQSDAPWLLYQDSSGGAHWNSSNHVDDSGAPSVSFCGYRVESVDGGSGARISEGARATPCLQVLGESAWMAATVENFWQNFPKALRWKDGALSIGLFPGESRARYELQGGEQKRHAVLLDFGLPHQESSIPRLQHPLAAWADPAAIEPSRAVPYFIPAQSDSNAEYLNYIGRIVEGPCSFFSKREIIDEYGWRHFGDLYADHEAVRRDTPHPGPLPKAEGVEGSPPLVSHYNNQYDFIHGALVHFMRTGDVRWRRLAEDAARHTIDIDIYHTSADKAAYNGGLFWHTDHYLDAATCTHRTFSRRNANGGNYGGGPSNEHNYTSGLLYYYYLSGDPEAALAVRELADWVIAMDDGARTLLGLFDPRPTGHASQTVDPAYHKPGRGAGNSINALLDAYALSGERDYLSKAETLIQRCIHPADDIDALQLGEPEHRWSYLVFLQVLGRYLDTKVALGELDYAFYYARDALRHYAQWMAAHEVPYKRALHKVKIPTETWPAHDVRKCHVLHLAAQHSTGAQRTLFTERAAFFFEHCLRDVLSFDTAYLTRPLVILCVYGHVHGYFQKYSTDPGALVTGPHAHDFGEPAAFVPQRAYLRTALREKLDLMSAELGRICRERIHDVRRHWPARRRL